MRITLLATLFASLSLAGLDTDVTLRIRITDSHSRFRMGEVIPVDLEFYSSSSDTYMLNLQTHNRSGRVGADSFHVTPNGRDPLRSYYAQWSFIMGGSIAAKPLTPEPQRIREDLNEWVALDRPGHYSLYVTSNRVSRIGQTQSEPLEVRSNTVEFDVEATDPGWQRQVVNSAVASLSSSSASLPEKEQAFRNLKFLDSDESVRELIRRLGELPEGERWDAKAGLLGSARRTFVVREMERQISDPEIAVPYEYVSVLASLKVDETHEPLSAFPPKDEAQQKRRTEMLAARNKAQLETEDSLFRVAAGSVAMKRGRARSETVLALLDRQRGQRAEISGEDIASAFVGLSEEQQQRVLDSERERFRVAAMAAPLKKLVQRPKVTVHRLRDSALRALNEIDAEEGRRNILEEIRHPHLEDGTFTVTAETLGLLPEKSLPELDPLLLSRLEAQDARGVDLDAQLLGRYGSSGSLQRAKAVYQRGVSNWDCVSSDGFVMYFLRADPDFAVRELSRIAGFCMTRSLEEVTRIGRWGEVEPSVIHEIREANWNGRNAVDTLGRYGSLKAKEALWERMKQFHREWEDREQDFSGYSQKPQKTSDAQSFQYGLTEALGRAQGWVLSNEEVAELEALTVGQQKENVRRWRYQEPVDVSVNFSLNSEFYPTVHQYFAQNLAGLARKMGQYPAGTRFLVGLYGPSERLGSVRDAVNAGAREHGLAVEITTGLQY